MTVKQLQRLFDAWIQRLGLGAWRITVETMDSNDLPQGHEGSCGTSGSNSDARNGNIRLAFLRSFSKSDKTLGSALDAEGTVVHELLHLLLADTGIEEHPERLVHQLERLLVEGQRLLPLDSVKEFPECHMVRNSITKEWHMVEDKRSR